MKEIRCFLINNSYIIPSNRNVSPVYELSSEGYTFAKHRQEVWIEEKERAVLSFHYTKETELNVEEASLIFKVVEAFVQDISTKVIDNKSEIIANFIRAYNQVNPKKIVSLDYNTIIEFDGAKYPDFITFEVDNLICSVWLSDQSFKVFYPLYDIDIVTPFARFDDVLDNVEEMVYELEIFDLSVFAERIDQTKEGYPSTYSKILNVPYYPTKKGPAIDCYFGFNVYGRQGNYDHLIRDELYDYLNKDKGKSPEWIEEHFPDIFKVNEFFIVPLWDRYAIPFKVGQGSVNSQVIETFEDEFNVPLFVQTYDTDIVDLKKNTYNVPFNHSHLLAHVVNGRYSTEDIRKFTDYYNDYICVPTPHPDFSRMKERTQRFITMMEYMLEIADSMTETEIFSKIMAVKEHSFSLSKRSGVNFISVLYRDHRYYVVPRYEYENIIKGAE